MKTLTHAPEISVEQALIPVIPTMDVVVFPHMIVPLLVLDEKIINGINKALQDTKLVLLLAARKNAGSYDAIGTQDLYRVGTIASIMRIIEIPEGGVKILVQGMYKAYAKDLLAQDDQLVAILEEFPEVDDSNDPELDAHIKNLQELAEKMASSGQYFSPDFHVILSKMQDPHKIADFILSHLKLTVDQAQALLETTSTTQLMAGIYQYLHKEIEIAQVQERIKHNARESMNNAQKEYYLREQLKAIKKELGEEDAEIEGLREKIESLKLTEAARTEAQRQLSRLERMSSDSMEAAVIRTYLDWLVTLPWGIETPDKLDIAYAKSVLDQDHYGLRDIKDRILDFISIRKLKQTTFAPILCLVGPPGTGKTSLGQSIAKSLGRNFVRVALGGIKDEAEIRGHRRTYVGAMPGRIIQGMRKAASCNPVVMIDEIDKIGADFRGDPSAALLELLDPHQNNTFYDNYLGVPFDLSRVMFIATANTLDTISEPLKDRMEIIRLSGYTLEEKINIAKQYLVNKAIIDSGLEGKQVTFDDELLQMLVRFYTREAGVRQIERLIRKVCSKVARKFVETNELMVVNGTTIESIIGPKLFLEEEAVKQHQIGVTNGLAWTVYGGELLRIEAILMKGKGKLILTGQLGSVMKESAQAAYSYARAHAQDFKISEKFFTDYDLHIHVPAGAVPKDGPSAGISMLSSILSALTQRPINAHYAMTGELNLHGEVMPIGGVKEKILAAKRNGITHIILPNKNKNDLLGLEDVIKDINVVWVEDAAEVIKHVLMPHNDTKPK